MVEWLNSEEFENIIGKINSIETNTKCVNSDATRKTTWKHWSRTTSFIRCQTQNFKHRSWLPTKPPPSPKQRVVRSRHYTPFTTTALATITRPSSATPQAHTRRHRDAEPIVVMSTLGFEPKTIGKYWQPSKTVVLRICSKNMQKKFTTAPIQFVSPISNFPTSPHQRVEWNTWPQNKKKLKTWQNA